MAELYKGIEGSPITYLSSDISASQTTISIDDDSAIPDAPNICTIGYGENIETIKYETKSNGVLQNVTRGIEGTPRAWQKGTEVGRFFTAYDHNAIVEKYNSIERKVNEFFGLGKRINEGEDMLSSEYRRPGIYYTTQSSTARTLKNCPMDQAFRLEIKYSNGEGRVLQKYIQLYGREIIIQSVTSQGVERVYKYEGVQI